MTTPESFSSATPLRRATRKADAPPRYVWLHACLHNDINSGIYPVGTFLPTEEQLGKTYGVSRHTVREATRKLARALQGRVGCGHSADLQWSNFEGTGVATPFGIAIRQSSPS